MLAIGLIFHLFSEKTTKPAILLIPLVLGISAVILLLSIPSLQARGAPGQQQSIIMVNTLQDDEVLNGNCTLREAITAANINYMVDKCQAGSTLTDTINFSVAGTISLTGSLPYI